MVGGRPGLARVRRRSTPASHAPRSSATEAKASAGSRHSETSAPAASSASAARPRRAGRAGDDQHRSETGRGPARPLTSGHSHLDRALRPRAEAPVRTAPPDGVSTIAATVRQPRAAAGHAGGRDAGTRTAASAPSGRPGPAVLRPRAAHRRGPGTRRPMQGRAPVRRSSDRPLRAPRPPARPVGRRSPQRRSSARFITSWNASSATGRARPAGSRRLAAQRHRTRADHAGQGGADRGRTPRAPRPPDRTWREPARGGRARREAGRAQALAQLARPLGGERDARGVLARRPRGRPCSGRQGGQVVLQHGCRAREDRDRRWPGRAPRPPPASPPARPRPPSSRPPARPSCPAPPFARAGWARPVNIRV